MVIAGVLIKTLPGAAPKVALQLARESFLQLLGGDGNEKIAAVVQRETGAELEAWASELVETNHSVIGVFPTYVAQDEQ
ncbi:MAG: hypothetical protein ACUVRY_00795 [Thermoanaerobaculaceae bacterium]